MLLLKNLLFTVLVPGTVAVLIPYWGVTNGPETLPEAWRAPQFFALMPAALGIGIYLWCLWDFASYGRGTPAPIDPPKRLVVRGLYRFVRNPMYVGVLCVILGWGLFFESWRLLRYAGLVFVMFHLFVVFLEEPMLEDRFGAAYERYRREVPRWLPRA